MLRLRTIIVFLILLLFVFLVVEFVSFTAIVIFFNILLIFINSVFLFAYLESKPPKKTRIGNWPSLSIIIPNYNGEGTIKRCVEAVKKLRYKGKKEILVVDDGSYDRSKDVLNGIKGIRCIFKKENAGKAAALNTGINAAKNEVIVTIDSDTFPSPDSLEKMVPFLQKGVGAVTGFVRADNAKGLVEKIQEVEYLVAFGFFQKVLSDINAILVTPGPMSVYDAKLLKKLGGFDVNNITEDMEIAFRIRKAGFRIVTCLDAHIYTAVPTNLKHLFRQRVRWYRGKFFNTIKYSEMLGNKKYGEFGLFHFPFSVIVEWSVVLFVFVFIAGNIENFFNFLGLAYFFSSSGGNFATLSPQLFIFNSSFFFYLIGAIFYAIFLYFSHELAGVKLSIKRIPEITAFLIIYSFFILSVFFTGFFKEINDSEKIW